MIQFLATVRHSLFIPLTCDGLVAGRHFAAAKVDSQEWLSYLNL
jgi:hypothetical protein